MASDEQIIRALVESWAAAVRRRDIEAVLAHHAPDLVMFDVPPPFEVRGLQAYRASWDLFFGWSVDPVAFDIQRMEVTAGSDVAFVVAAMRCTGPDANGAPEPLDFRLTIGLRKIAGAWTITHEHHSIPAVD